MNTTRQVAKKKPEPPSPVTPVSQLELIHLFQRRSVHELVIVEVEPSVYRIEMVIAYRTGRSTLMGARAPRQFRSLDTLVRLLKTLGTGRIVTRLECLPPA